jgi:hypothetical protein
MSHMLNNRPDESGNNSERSYGDNLQRTRGEGFEGMNYEQRRPSYPAQSNTEKNDPSRSSEGKRRDEL